MCLPCGGPSWAGLLKGRMSLVAGHSYLQGCGLHLPRLSLPQPTACMLGNVSKPAGLVVGCGLSGL